jgi:hypothetical protein
MRQCKNCNSSIGNLERAFVWKNYVVCFGCYNKLNAAIEPISTRPLLPIPPVKPPPQLLPPPQPPIPQNPPENLEEIITALPPQMPVFQKPYDREESNLIKMFFQIVVVFGMFWFGFYAGNWWNDRQHMIDSQQIIEEKETQDFEQAAQDAKNKTLEPFHANVTPDQ